MTTARQVQTNRRDGALSTAPSVPQAKTISLTKRISRGRWGTKCRPVTHDNLPPNHRQQK